MDISEAVYDFLKNTVFKKLAPVWDVFRTYTAIQAIFNMIQECAPLWAYHKKLLLLKGKSHMISGYEFYMQENDLELTKREYKFAFAIESILITSLTFCMLTSSFLMSVFHAKPTYMTVIITVSSAVMTMGSSVYMHYGTIMYDHPPYTHNIILAGTCMVFPFMMWRAWMSLPQGTIGTLATTVKALQTEHQALQKKQLALQTRLNKDLAATKNTLTEHNLAFQGISNIIVSLERQIQEIQEAMKTGKTTDRPVEMQLEVTS